MKVSNTRILAFLQDIRQDLISEPENVARAIELQATQNLIDFIEVISDNKLTIQEVIETFRSTRRPLPGEQQRLGL